MKHDDTNDLSLRQNLFDLLYVHKMNTKKNNHPKIYGLFPHCWMHANTWIVHAHWRWGSNSVILTIPSLKVSCHLFSRDLVHQQVVNISFGKFPRLALPNFSISTSCRPIWQWARHATCRGHGNRIRPRRRARPVPHPMDQRHLKGLRTLQRCHAVRQQNGQDVLKRVSPGKQWTQNYMILYMFESVISRCIIHMYPHLTRSKIGKSGWKLTHSRCILGRSLEGRGLFVNLGALGIERGCFQDDCSHSDHFEAVTPAECAKICKKSLGWSDKT